MRKRLYYISFILLLLALTIGVMARSGKTPVDGYLEELRVQIAGEEWSAAADTLAALNREWKRRRVWLLLDKSVERIFTADQVLALLQVRVDLRDRAAASERLAELTEIWRDLIE